MSVSGTIFNIQRYSIHDGEGIRTVVFFKGCPLRCCWCCNPESQTVRTELMHYTQYCRACGSCVKVCPLGALSLEEGKLAINRKVCDGCFLCAEACPNGALKGAGKTMSAQQVIEIVIRDSIMYESSGGGLTLSGGEPALQPEFAREILQLAAQNGIDCTLETCGATDFRPLESLVRLCSHVLFDIKIVDSAVHKMYVGTDNARVLENAKKLANDPKVRFRIPVIPGVTGTRENFTCRDSATVDTVLSGRHRSIRLLSRSSRKRRQAE